MGVLLKLTKEYFGESQRNEDKFVTNIEEMKEIDLGKNFPLIFADRDLIVNDMNTFTWYDVERFLDKIKKTGWDLPPYKGFESMFENLDFEWKSNDNMVVIGTKESNEKICFDVSNSIFWGKCYWLEADRKPSNPDANKTFAVKHDRIIVYNFEKKNHFGIRLVKYKFPDEDFFK